MRSLLKLTIAMTVVGALLSGCGSGRHSVRSGGSGQITDIRGKQGGGSPSKTPVKISAEELLRGVSDPMARALILEAHEWLGTQYVYGGASRAGTDCSGFVMNVYNNACGVKIPRTTRDQVRYCTQIARNRLAPGDLIFFGRGQSADSVSHVGMYVGDGRMIHASSSRGVIVSDFDRGYWADKYCTGARVDAAPMAFAKLSKTNRRTIQPTPTVNPVAPTPPPPPAAQPAPQPVPQPASQPAPQPVPLPAANQTLAVSPANSSPTLTIDLLDMIISAKVDSIADVDPDTIL